MRCASCVLGIGLLAAACSSFSEVDPAAPDGGIDAADDAHGTTDTGADAAPMDSASGDGDADAGLEECTTFGSEPLSMAGWMTTNTGGGMLGPSNEMGVPALQALVSDANQTEVVYRKVSFSPKGELAIHFDFDVKFQQSSQSTGSVTLMKVSCASPPRALTLAVDANATLVVGVDAASASSIGPAPSEKVSFDLLIGAATLNVMLDGVSSSLGGVDFEGALGCTLQLGAASVAVPPKVSANYFKACVN